MNEPFARPTSQPVRDATRISGREDRVDPVQHLPGAATGSQGKGPCGQALCLQG